MIRDHHFFEGDSKYRLDPALAIDVLGIEPGINYSLNSYECRSWKAFSFTDTEKNDLQGAIDNQMDCVKGENFDAYLLPYKDYNTYKDRGLTLRQKINEEGRSEGKSQDQINQDVQEYVKCRSKWGFQEKALIESLDKPIWETDGKNYLHVFTHNPEKPSVDETVYVIGNAVLLGSAILNCPYIKYEVIDSKIPIMEETDVLITKDQVN